MDMSAIVTAIGSIGFPIVMCIIMFNYIKSTQDALVKSIDALTDTVKELEQRLKNMVGE